ncbi:MAG: heat-inducible transcription repressor HrcA [Clostridia bacterium]|nr:heat-inducible transcription repressor HrcA [Clostridia bacterium]MBR2433188.1 heat-inducible transcription repressor HrcA [Clostridia bacterium]
MEPTLTPRKHNVLIGAIEDYIKDASPITSQGVQAKHIKDISTATLRNELNALEAMGYLKQLHTSSGRVPTTMGYRYYVNHLLGDITLNEDALQKVRTLLDNRSDSLTEVVGELAKLIASAVNYPTVIVANGYDKLVIQSIKVFPLVDGQALTLIQTKSGYITNTIKTGANQKACQDASKYLTKYYKNKTIKEMFDTIEETENQMLGEIASFKLIVDNLIDGMKEVLHRKKLSIETSGSAALLTEGNDTEQTKKVLKLLDNQSQLEKTLGAEEDDLSITLVEEEAFSGCALVKAPIIIDGKAVAHVGVLGPQRMDYRNIASALKVVMMELNALSEKKELTNG